MTLMVVDGYMFQACYGESEPDPTAWDVLRCDEWQHPWNDDDAAELAVEHHLYDGSDHPDCGYVDVWIKNLGAAETSLYRVHIDFSVEFSGESLRRL